MRFSVKKNKKNVRIFFLSGINGRLEFESRTDNHLIAGIRKVSDFLEIVRLGCSGRLEVLCLYAHVLLGAENSFPSSLIEGLVIDCSGVRNHSDPEIRLLGILLLSGGKR